MPASRSFPEIFLLPTALPVAACEALGFRVTDCNKQ